MPSTSMGVALPLLLGMETTGFRGGECACHAILQMKGTHIIISYDSATNLASALKLSIVVEIFWE